MRRPFTFRRTLIRFFEGLKRLKQIKNARGFKTLANLDPFAIRSLLPRRIPSRAQFMFLPRVLTAAERWILPIAFLLAIFSGWTLFVRVSAPWRISIPANGGIYTEAVSEIPRTANPLFATLSTADMDIVRLVYSPLFSPDLNRPTVFVPVIAKGFSINAAGTVYTVPIRSDFRWHDGTPLTIDDVLFTIQRIQDPVVRSPFAGALAGVTVKKSAADTLEFTLPAPLSTFLASLTWGVLPAHRWNGRTNWQTMDPELIGSGPFHLKSIDRTENAVMTGIILERFPEFPNPAYIQTLSLRFFPNASSALSALDRRKVDGVFTRLFPEAQSILKRRSDIESRSLALPEYTALFFNPREQPIFADLNLRRALVAALPKRTIVEQVFGDSATLANGIFTPEIYPLKQTPDETPDATAANQMLSKAGWRISNGVRINAQKKTLRFSLTTPDTPSYASVAERVAAAWRELGAEVTVVRVDSSKIFNDVIRPRGYDVLLFGQNLSADPDPFTFWHSSQVDDPGLNFALWHNSKADDFIDQARSNADPELRKTLYAQLEEVLRNDTPAAILTHPKALYLTTNKLHGINLKAIATSDDRFANIQDWYLNTKSVWKFRRQ